MSVFRNQYRELSAEEKDAVLGIKQAAEMLYDIIETTKKDPRAAALAKTKLEECVFWAVKGITG